MKKLKKDEQTPLFLFILIVVLVLITFALITISDNLRDSGKREGIMQELKDTEEGLENLNNEYFQDVN